MQYLGYPLFFYLIFNLFYVDLIASALILLYAIYSFARPAAGRRFMQRLPLLAIFFCLLFAYGHVYIKYSPNFYFYMDREDLCVQAVGHTSEPVVFEVGPPMRVACKNDDGSLVELIPAWVNPAIYYLQYATMLAFLAVLGRWIWRKAGLNAPGIDPKNTSASASNEGPPASM